MAYLAVFRFSYLPLIGTLQIFFSNGNLYAVDVRQTFTGFIREIHNQDQVMLFYFFGLISEGRCLLVRVGGWASNFTSILCVFFWYFFVIAFLRGPRGMG